MKTIIYCKPTSKGIHSFYLVTGSDEYYLFSQSYRKGVAEYYGQGVHISNAMNYAKSHHDSAITKTMSKLPMYIKYIEQEFDVVVMEKTRRKGRARG